MKYLSAVYYQPFMIIVYFVSVSASLCECSICLSVHSVCALAQEKKRARY